MKVVKHGTIKKKMYVSLNKKIKKTFFSVVWVVDVSKHLIHNTSKVFDS